MKTPDYVGIAREAAAERRRSTMCAVPDVPATKTSDGTHWREYPKKPMGHLSLADQINMILSLVLAGHILVLEAEDGTRYRCHGDGAELPPGVGDLPRAELPPYEDKPAVPKSEPVAVDTHHPQERK